MALTKRQVKDAAKLYSLSMAAHADAGGAETDEAMHVMHTSQALAEAALARLGYEKAELVTIQDCIAAVRKRHILRRSSDKSERLRKSHD